MYVIVMYLSGVLSLSAADSQSVSQSQENSDSSSESEADSSQTAKPVTDYTTYVSNTVISTGNNFYIEEAENITYRAYLPVEEYGELEYKFFFTNDEMTVAFSLQG